MKTIDYSFITTTKWQPFEQITWNVLQASYQEVIAKMIIANIGPYYSTSAVYVLYGCESSVAFGNTTISAGAVFTNGLVYLSPSQTFPNPTGGDVILSRPLITPLDTDSVSGTQFSDGSFNYVHLDTTAFYYTGVSGSGTLNGSSGTANNYNNFIHLDAANILLSVGPSAYSVGFTRSAYIATVVSPVAGAANVTMDGTNAVAGSEVIFAFNVTSGDVITLVTAGGATVQMITPTTSLTAAHTAPMYIRMKCIVNKTITVEVFNNV